MLIKYQVLIYDSISLSLDTRQAFNLRVWKCCDSLPDMSCTRSAMQLHPAGRRPTAKGEKRKAGRRERIQHKRLQYTESRAPVDVSSLRRDVTHAGAAQTAARYVKVGHPARILLHCRYYRCCWYRVADAIYRGQLPCVLWQRIVSI